MIDFQRVKQAYDAVVSGRVRAVSRERIEKLYQLAHVTESFTHEEAYDIERVEKAA